MTEFKLSKNKIIVCGDYIEFYQYERPYMYNVAPDKRNSISDDDDESSGSNDRQKLFNILRAKDSLRRLINSNVNKNIPPLFLTLTYDTKQLPQLLPQYNQAIGLSDCYSNKKKPPSVPQVTIEPNQYHEQQKLSISYYRHAMRYITEHTAYHPRYISVAEMQQRQVFHYHTVLFNVLPYSEQGRAGHERAAPTILSRDHLDNILPKAWPHGFYKLQGVHRIKNIGAYLSKYMVKDWKQLEHPKGLKRYYTSRGLRHPVVIHNSPLDVIYNESTLKLVVSRDYYKQKYGKVLFKQYVKK